MSLIHCRRCGRETLRCFHSMCTTCLDAEAGAAVEVRSVSLDRFLKPAFPAPLPVMPRALTPAERRAKLRVIVGDRR